MSLVSSFSGPFMASSCARSYMDSAVVLEIVIFVFPVSKGSKDVFHEEMKTQFRESMRHPIQASSATVEFRRM